MIESIQRKTMRYAEFTLNQIVLDELGQSPRVQVLRVGSFKHPKYGNFEITQQTLAEMKSNFENKVRGIDIALDYFHEFDKVASGWIKNLLLLNENNELWAEVEWTPRAKQMLTDRELRYFSPDFAFQWSDPETGILYKNVLFGGGLTNRPFVKEMQAIVAAEQKGESMTIEQLKEQLKLAEEKVVQAEDKAKGLQESLDAAPKMDDMEALKAKIAELEAKISSMVSEHEAMMTEKAKLQDQIKCAEKEKAFNILLTEGKACAAQKEAYVKGDMEEFIRLAQPVNLKAAGNGGGTGEGKEEDKETKVLRLADEKMKLDAKLDRSDAILLALKEVK